MEKIEDIVIPWNYVMIKPDTSFKTYQMNGRDTGIGVSPIAESDGQNLNVRAKVYGIPGKLIYNGDEIEDLDLNMPNDPSKNTMVGDLRISSMMYKVDIEVSVGDEVLFGYQQYYDCYKNNRTIETEEGEMIFVRYDELVCKITETPGGSDFYMLNGFVLVEPIHIPYENDKGVKIFVTKKGVKIPLMKSTMLRKKRLQFGRFVKQGCLCDGYRDFPGLADTEISINTGDIVIFNPSFAQNIEYELHQTLTNGKFYRVSRKDIYSVMPSKDFNINSIISQFL